MEGIFSEIEERMKKTVDVLVKQYSKIYMGRANPSILDNITVDYYGTATPISQLASISVTESRVLTIHPWDISIINAIEKAIHKSNIGINPQNDGKIIRLIFPPPTEEMRKSISKDVLKMSEELKVSIRSIRRDYIDKLKIQAGITEDNLRDGEKEIQNITDRHIKNIDEIRKAKSQEIMTL